LLVILSEAKDLLRKSGGTAKKFNGTHARFLAIGASDVCHKRGSNCNSCCKPWPARVLLFRSSADSAPKTVKASMSISARVAEVDCTNRLVKAKACAPLVVT
jgi:hypothetical protein